MTQFGFTKLLVEDLDKTAAFYKAVCGLMETRRIQASIGGRPIDEILFAPARDGAATFILLKYLDAPRDAIRPGADEVILGFMTSDVDAFVQRAQSAGGRVVEAPHDSAEHGIRVAFVADIEGHMLEIVQPL